MKFANKLLSEVAFFQEGPGVRKFQFRNEGVKLLNVGNINKGVLDTSTTKLYISEEEAYGKYKHFLVDEGDLLIASSGIVVDNFHNKIAYVKKEHLPLCLNTSTIRFKTLDENAFSLDYLKFYLKTTHFKNQLKKLITGAAQLNFGPSHLKKITLPVPSVPDQLHIANILNKAENLIAQRKESICLLDEFLKSTFLEMFGNVTRNEKGFERIKFGKVAKNENSKRVPVKQADRDKREGIYPYYGATGVIDTIDDYKFDGEYLLIAEDGKNLLFRRKNNAFLASGKFWVNNHAHVLSYSGVCNLRYLEFFLNNIDFRPYISGIDQVKLNKENLDKIPVPIPPTELQTQFAQIVEKTEALKTQYQQSLQELENLYGSLSQRAFKGELSLKEESVLSSAELGRSMAAEPKSSYVAQSNIPDNKRGFAKQVLGGKIVSLFKDDNNFAHIKFQKLQYLAEQIAEENLHWNYYRQTAGPHDNKFKYSVIAKLNENNWFEERNYKFYPLQKASDVDRYYQKIFGNKSDRLNEFFLLLKNATEKFCEAIATIYAVWNNHIILQLPYNKSNIKKDFFEWSKRKTNVFTEDEFEKALEWMKKHNIEPIGFGQLIKEGSGKK